MSLYYDIVWPYKRLKVTLISLAVIVAIYAAFVFALYLLGTKQDARAWTGFIPEL